MCKRERERPHRSVADYRRAATRCLGCGGDDAHPPCAKCKWVDVKWGCTRNCREVYLRILSGEDTGPSEREIERQDTVDNAVHQVLCVLTQRESLEWDMEVIADARDALVAVLADHRTQVWVP